MAENDSSLSSKKQRAIIALVTEDSITAAAKAAEVSERSIYRWQHDPEFKRAYNTASQMLQVSIINRLRASKGAIMDSIRRIIEDQSIPPQVRAKTALEAFKSLADDRSLQESFGGSDLKDPVDKIIAAEAELDQKEERVGEVEIREEIVVEAEEEFKEKKLAVEKGIEIRERLLKVQENSLQEDKERFEKEKKEWEEG